MIFLIYGGCPSLKHQRNDDSAQSNRTLSYSKCTADISHHLGSHHHFNRREALPYIKVYLGVATANIEELDTIVMGPSQDAYLAWVPFSNPSHMGLVAAIHLEEVANSRIKLLLLS